MPAECYLCGRPLARRAPNPDDRPTRDHVPPQSLFPRPLPGNVNLITLACCRPCQDAYTADEEYLFQNLATIAPASTNQQAGELWQRAKRGIKVSPAVVREFVARLRRATVRNPDGTAQKHVAITFDAERASRVFRKVARGLLYHHTGTRDPAHDNAYVCWQPRDVPDLQQLVNLAQYKRRINDAFAYAGAFAEDDPSESTWTMWFFNQVVVVSFGGADP